MASYRGRLSLDRPFVGVIAAIYDLNDARVDANNVDRYGFYDFDNLQTGPYILKFFGRGYGGNDNINISVVDEFDAAELAPLAFYSTPDMGVVEGEPFSSQQGEASKAEFTLSNLLPSTGVLGSVEL
tara:strand:- start:1587 stop:1967 length:381 start_codon:yes stop_codon:yes gene_type:complete